MNAAAALVATIACALVLTRVDDEWIDVVAAVGLIAALAILARSAIRSAGSPHDSRG